MTDGKGIRPPLSEPSSGIPGLDRIINGIRLGDNVVWQIESIEDYGPFVLPYCIKANQDGRQLIYFRFAQHPFLLPKNIQCETYELNPEEGFEPFITEILSVIEEAGKEAFYVFDCLSELAVDWYSDRMLGNFFMLTCPFLYDFDTVAYFALMRNHHTSSAIKAIHDTAQVVLDIHKNNENIYLQPLKVDGRYSPTMYMLHSWENDSFKHVTRSATVTEILSKVPQPWLDFTVQRYDLWTRTFTRAQEILDAQNEGKADPEEVVTYFERLLRMIVTRETRIIDLSRKYLSLSDLLGIRKRMIGTGLVGGKSVGMLLARAILKKKDPKWTKRLESHDSFFIGSDVFYTFLVQNDCWWITHKRMDLETLLDKVEEAKARILAGNFSENIRNQFIEMLDYFGQAPIIVRSSSLLEDAYGNAFSGKYESVFCTNQGTPNERLEELISAVKTVYASTMSREALCYRAQRGLLDLDEQMALLIQRVSGDMNGKYFFPQVSGVGFSFNPYAWSKDIDPKAGVLRLVFGLGTRAVDRHDEDYTRVVALNAPEKRLEASFDAIRKFSQRFVDVLDLNANSLLSTSFETMLEAVPDIPVDMFVSYDKEMERRARDMKVTHVESRVLTFNHLLSKTEFINEIKEMLQVLQEAYNYPVDIEMTANFLEDESFRINMLQCRPFQIRANTRIIQPPDGIPKKDLIIKTTGPVVGNSLATRIDRLIYVVPDVYGKMSESNRYSIARVIGRLTHLEEDNNQSIMLVGPGRWGTTTPSLGVPVSFPEINTVSVLCEIEAMHEGLIPDISVGTHFFNDLVELDMLYFAIMTNRKDTFLNEPFFLKSPNQLGNMLPDETEWEKAISVIDPARISGGQAVYLNVNSIKQEGVLYIRKD